MFYLFVVIQLLIIPFFIYKNSLHKCYVLTPFHPFSLFLLFYLLFFFLPLPSPPPTFLIFCTVVILIIKFLVDCEWILSCFWICLVVVISIIIVSSFMEFNSKYKNEKWKMFMTFNLLIVFFFFGVVVVFVVVGLVWFGFRMCISGYVMLLLLLYVFIIWLIIMYRKKGFTKPQVVKHELSFFGAQNFPFFALIPPSIVYFKYFWGFFFFITCEARLIYGNFQSFFLFRWLWDENKEREEV